MFFTQYIQKLLFINILRWYFCTIKVSYFPLNNVDYQSICQECQPFFGIAFFGLQMKKYCRWFDCRWRIPETSQRRCGFNDRFNIQKFWRPSLQNGFYEFSRTGFASWHNCFPRTYGKFWSQSSCSNRHTRFGFADTRKRIYENVYSQHQSTCRNTSH